jgi:hypothetical protein
MKIIYNHFLPIPGFEAMMLFGVIFARKKYRPISEATIRHEMFHELQVRQDYQTSKIDDRIPPSIWAWIKFYAVYLSQWVRYGYRSIPFEQEAYMHCNDDEYIRTREKKAWKKYL